MTDTDHLAAQYRHDITRIQRDIEAVCRVHLATVALPLIAHALIETTGSVCAAVLETASPAVRAELIRKVSDLEAFVAGVTLTRQ